MNVAVKPAVERPEFRAHQDEGLGDLGRFQESVQIIHHPGEQLICVSTKNTGHSAQTLGGGRGLAFAVHKPLPYTTVNNENGSLTCLLISKPQKGSREDRLKPKVEKSHLKIGTCLF